MKLLLPCYEVLDCMERYELVMHVSSYLRGISRLLPTTPKIPGVPQTKFCMLIFRSSSARVWLTTGTTLVF